MFVPFRGFQSSPRTLFIKCRFLRSEESLNSTAGAHRMPTTAYGARVVVQEQLLYSQRSARGRSNVTYKTTLEGYLPTASLKIVQEYSFLVPHSTRRRLPDGRPIRWPENNTDVTHVPCHFNIFQHTHRTVNWYDRQFSSEMV